jgi:hypothetical protein
MKPAIIRPCFFSRSLRVSLKRFTLSRPRQWHFVSRQRKARQPKARLSFSFHPWEWLRRTLLDPQRGQIIVSKAGITYRLVGAKKFDIEFSMLRQTNLPSIYYIISDSKIKNSEGPSVALPPTV